MLTEVGIRRLALGRLRGSKTRRGDERVWVDIGVTEVAARATVIGGRGRYAHSSLGEKVERKEAMARLVMMGAGEVGDTGKLKENRTYPWPYKNRKFSGKLNRLM